MENETHTMSASKHSSTSKPRSTADVTYRNEKEFKTFESDKKASSISAYSSTITWKVARSSVNKEEKPARFSLNLPKIAKEEANYRLNRKLRGKRIVAVSSSSD